MLYHTPNLGVNFLTRPRNNLPRGEAANDLASSYLHESAGQLSDDAYVSAQFGETG